MTEQPLVLQSIQFLPNFASWKGVTNKCTINSLLIQHLKNHPQTTKNKKQALTNMLKQLTLILNEFASAYKSQQNLQNRLNFYKLKQPNGVMPLPDSLEYLKTYLQLRVPTDEWV